MNVGSDIAADAGHVVGESYDFQTIRNHLKGETAPPNFVIHRDGSILGLCLGLLWNPRAEDEPCEVWVGKKRDLPGWGLRLADTTGPFPVYVRREEGGQWIYKGLYEVNGSSTEPEAIRQRLQPPVITGISRIVFLKRADVVLPPPSSQ
ncbi:MAG: hypothetical protein O2960_01775 [Verrucomicrobia bacterium]|nr:hypothetical protein [Verrucomicrobiota bacterium]